MRKKKNKKITPRFAEKLAGVAQNILLMKTNTYIDLAICTAMNHPEMIRMAHNLTCPFCRRKFKRKGAFTRHMKNSGSCFFNLVQVSREIVETCYGKIDSSAYNTSETQSTSGGEKHAH